MHYVGATETKDFGPIWDIQPSIRYNKGRDEFCSIWQKLQGASGAHCSNINKHQVFLVFTIGHTGLKASRVCTSTTECV